MMNYTTNELLTAISYTNLEPKNINGCVGIEFHARETGAVFSKLKSSLQTISPNKFGTPLKVDHESTGGIIRMWFTDHKWN